MHEVQFMQTQLSDADNDDYAIVISVNTAVATAADDASQCDVIAPHPEHLLLINMGSCSTTRLVGYSCYCIEKQLNVGLLLCLMLCLEHDLEVYLKWELTLKLLLCTISTVT